MTIAGWATIRPRPAAAMTANQTTITGPKTRPITWVPKRWIENRAGEDRDRDRQHQRLQAGLDDLHPFDRGEDRDRRGDDAVAVEEGDAEHAERDQHRLHPAVAQRRPLDLGDQGQDPALAVVVGAHDEEHELDRDDQRDRPEDQRDHPEDVPFGRLHRLVVGGRRRSAARRAGWCRCRRRRRRAPRGREPPCRAGGGRAGKPAATSAKLRRWAPRRYPTPPSRRPLRCALAAHRGAKEQRGVPVQPASEYAGAAARSPCSCSASGAGAPWAAIVAGSGSRSTKTAIATAIAASPAPIR